MTLSLDDEMRNSCHRSRRCSEESGEGYDDIDGLALLHHQGAVEAHVPSP